MAQQTESLRRMAERFDAINGVDFARIVEKFRRHNPKNVRVEIRTGLSEKGLPELWFRIVELGDDGGKIAAMDDPDDDDWSYPCPGSPGC